MSRTLFLIGVVLAFAPACQNDDEHDAPAIEVQLKKNGQPKDPAALLRGKIDIVVNASDASGIRAIAVSVDNQVLEQKSDVSTATITFDTKQMTDGNHHLAVEVTDKNGNVGLEEMDVTIKNFLMTYSIPSINRSYWVVISDAAGKVVSSGKVGNNSTASFLYNDDFDGDVFNVTLVRRETAVSGDIVFDLDTYTNVTSDAYFLKVKTTANPGNELGTYTLLVPDWINYYAFSANSEALSSINFFDDDTRIEMGLRESPSNLYLSLVQNDGDVPRYRYSSSIEVSGETTIDQTAIDAMAVMTAKNFSSSASTVSGEIFIEGKTINKKMVFPIWFSTINSGSPTTAVYYPNALTNVLFQSYTTRVFYEKTTDVFYGFTKEATTEPATEFAELNVALDQVKSKTISKLSIVTAGQASYVDAGLHYQADNIFFDWNVYTSMAQNIDINLPQFTSDLLEEIGMEFLNDGLDFTQVTFTENADVSSYSALYTAALKDNGDPVAMKNVGEKTYVLGSNGGRQRSLRPRSSVAESIYKGIRPNSGSPFRSWSLGVAH